VGAWHGRSDANKDTKTAEQEIFQTEATCSKNHYQQHIDISEGIEESYKKRELYNVIDFDHL
jgi:hypothetical protein